MRIAGPALISALLAAHAAPASALTTTGRLFFPAITQVRASRRAVALTFDDGPDACLEAFLGLLEEYEVRATFFAVGEQVERDPGRLKETFARGHEVAVHCYRHRNHLRLTPRQTIEDMRRARAVIEETTGAPTCLFRPPYGVFNAASWIEAGRQGWERVLWARWGRDWEARATPRSVADEIGLPAVGDIVLLHDSDRYAAPGSWRATLGALPRILERLDSMGLAACSVGDLLDSEECF
ncbi:MAG TPA: polysaccharide deacetylase family protein [Rubrobacteraceae bacterium]|nr:polysaccharide deacetylase family protein [Rubrobacteraceae bacterium]